MRPNRAVRGPTYVVWAEALEGETEATGPRLGPRDGALPCGRPAGAGGAQLRPAGPDGVGLDLGAVTSALPKYPGNRRCPVHPSSIASRAARVEEERAHPRRPLATEAWPARLRGAVGARERGAAQLEEVAALPRPIRRP